MYVVEGYKKPFCDMDAYTSLTLLQTHDNITAVFQPESSLFREHNRKG